MDFRLDDDQIALRDAVRKLSERHFALEAVASREGAPAADPAWRDLAAMGIFELLVPAGLLYLLAHCCWATFWVRLLHGQGIHVSWYAGMRAYFVSQFGKYVPGKVWVILMRVDMLRHQAHAHPLPVAVTATFETLCSMAAGAFLGFLMLPYLGVLPSELNGKTVALVAVAALPVGLGLLNKYAARVVAKRRGPDARPLRRDRPCTAPGHRQRGARSRSALHPAPVPRCRFPAACEWGGEWVQRRC